MKKRHYLTESDVLQVRQMIEVEHLQQWKVAESIGVHTGTIEKVVRRLGLSTERTGPRSGDGHTNWRGGRIQRKGYWYAYCPGHPNAVFGRRYVAEHRLAMEQKLGRYLLPTEVVHHIDSNPENNDPENLIVFGSNAQHLKEELTGRVPNWTPEGRKRSVEGVERWRQERRQSKTTHPNTRRDDYPQPRSTGHPTSESGSTGEVQAS
jgi:HNH endonuclease